MSLYSGCYHHTEASKKAISKALTGIPKSALHRKHMSEGMKGRIQPKGENSPNWRKPKKLESLLKESQSLKQWHARMTEEEKRIRNQKIAIKLKGRVCPNKGKPHSKEWNAKIATSNKGKPKAPLSPERLLIKTTRQFLTRKKNNTYNTSKEEKELYEQLLKEYDHKTIYKQYKDDKRYPYYCDFYIVEDDLFIELNAHWTHGGRPYDPNDVKCQEQLKIWQEKAKTSAFYSNAINVWTVRDVEKQKCAANNRLNYRVIYTD